jgi:CDP-diacylglycerol---serine O-phosphatidyltransferase
MNIKAHIPNFFTLLNLFCGCVALVFVSEMIFDWAFFFISLGIFFDFFDGFLARKFNVAGPLGVQLDSLADMVTSGVVPGYVMYQLLSNIQLFNENYKNDMLVYFLPFIGFTITIGACYRLAKFNIDTRQSDSFIGLPTPANALFIASLAVIIKDVSLSELASYLFDSRVLIPITFLSAYIMNAEIPLFSLKIKNFSFAKYKLQIFFLVLSVLMLIFLQILAVPLIIIFYVLLSVANNIVNQKASY